MKLSPEKSWLHEILFHGLVHTLEVNETTAME